MPGPKSGVGARHALFPIRTALGASLSRAVCFPTLLTAACDGVGLIAGPSRPFQTGIFRVRPLRPVRFHLPMVNSPDGCWHACNVCVSHQHLATGTAPAFGRALAPCNGSDLLPLRLLSTCGWVTRFYAPPQGGGFASFARLARSPLRRVPSAPRRLKPGLLVGWTHRNTALRPGNTVATETLWVTASMQGPKLALDLTRLGRGFLLRASSHSSFVAKLDRLRRRPEELVIFACHRLAPRRGERHQLPPTFPRLPGIIPIALSAGFSCRRAATVLSRNDEKMRPPGGKVTGLFLSSYSPGAVGGLHLAS